MQSLALQPSQYMLLSIRTAVIVERWAENVPKKVDKNQTHLHLCRTKEILFTFFSERVNLDKTPPIYAIVNKNRGSSSSFDNIPTPKSPPIPPRPERKFSETSSEGVLEGVENQNKSGGLVTSSFSDSPFKNKRIPKAFNKKKLTDEEVGTWCCT